MNNAILTNGTEQSLCTRPTAAVAATQGAKASSAYNHGCQTKIPLPKQSRMTPPQPLAVNGGKENYTPASAHVERWKGKYEDAERRYKGILVKNEKAAREYAELERKYRLLEERHSIVESQLLEKEIKLNKLRSVSEKVYKEYGQLKNQYDIETGAMHRAMQQAGEWYKQNRQLKRQSNALIQKISSTQLIDIDITDAVEAGSDGSGNDELEILRQTVADLSKEVASLQTELNSVKLQEFEATESNINLSQELESEKQSRVKYENECKELKAIIEQSERVSRHLIAEVTTLKEAAERDRAEAESQKTEAMKAKKERNVLAHQSALLMGELEMNDRLVMLMQEVDALKRSLEDQQAKHADEIDELQEKLADRDSTSETFLLEEKLKMAEEDAIKARQRAEAAENRIKQMKTNTNSVLSRVSQYENALKTQKSIEEVQSVRSVKSQTSLIADAKMEKETPDVVEEGDVSVVAPPAPPLPPPPPPNFTFPVVKTAGEKYNSDAIADMANMLGLKQSSQTKQKPSGGAIDEIISQIKCGKFQLKSAGNFMEKKPIAEEPPAVKEMLNILGTLRKKSRNRPAFITNLYTEGSTSFPNDKMADVQL